MPPKPDPDRFTLGEAAARADESDPSPTPKPKPKQKKAGAKKKPAPSPPPETVIVKVGVRQPNVSYERDAKLYVMVPKALKRQLDRAVLAEKEMRDPVPMDLSIAVEEAVRDWLKKRGHK